MQPVLARAAQARVDALVLGDEERRDDRQADVDRQGRRRLRRGHQQPGQTEHDREGVERGADALPGRQAARAMEPALVDDHDHALQHDRDHAGGEHQRFSSSSPHIVRPGPKARLTTGVPGATRGSSIRRAQTWGSVADDMLPWSRSTSRLMATWASRSSSTSRTRSMILGPPGWTANAEYLSASSVVPPRR